MRLKENVNNVRLDPFKHSVISEHIVEYNHIFYWENTKVLDIEYNYN